MKSKGDCSDQVHSDQTVLVTVRQGGGTTGTVAKGNKKLSLAHVGHQA
jgi:hypothetical protein